MGLDMNLEGEKYFRTDWKNPENNLRDDGYEVRAKTLRLGYWRKHPDLHGYIVNTFAGGVDNCEAIALEDADIEKIIDAVARDELPHTVGFFFGANRWHRERRNPPHLDRCSRMAPHQRRPRIPHGLLPGELVRRHP
jgi:hypothetical protein